MLNNALNLPGGLDLLIGAVVGLILLLYLVPAPLWIAARASGAHVGLLTLVGMRFRSVPPTTVATSRVTVRTNIDRLVGGAGEETIIARVGEGMVGTIGSATGHKSALENPDHMSRHILSKGLDAETAYETCRSTSRTWTSARTSAPGCRSTSPTPASRYGDAAEDRRQRR